MINHCQTLEEQPFKPDIPPILDYPTVYALFQELLTTVAKPVQAQDFDTIIGPILDLASNESEAHQLIPIIEDVLKASSPQAGVDLIGLYSHEPV